MRRAAYVSVAILGWFALLSATATIHALLERWLCFTGFSCGEIGLAKFVAAFVAIFALLGGSVLASTLATKEIKR